tara:strand:- start:371 stop:694 length:324 start_codon:yes stop_codon:yes gene_type:complete
MIDFQTEYTKELHELSDYPKIDFELIRKHFKEWEHHKVEDIMTYRNKSFSSPVTGSVAPIHHTPWASAMDDSSKNFFKSIKKIRYQKNYTSSQKEKASKHSPKISKT